MLLFVFSRRVEESRKKNDICIFMRGRENANPKFGAGGFEFGVTLVLLFSDGGEERISKERTAGVRL